MDVDVKSNKIQGSNMGDIPKDVIQARLCKLVTIPKILYATECTSYRIFNGI